MQTTLAIILVNWNGYKHTKACLSSLVNIKFQGVRIIVVDNASSDGSADLLENDFPNVELIRSDKNTGFTGGNNLGIQHALEQDAKYIMLLNNDTVVTPNFVKPLLHRLKLDESIGAIQPKINYNQEREIIWSAGSTYSNFWSISKHIGQDKRDQEDFNFSRDIPWITGCCFLVKSDVVKQIGLLDPKFFMYYEDMDWSFKIRQLGYRLVYEPRSVIYHEVGKSNESLENHNEGNLSPFIHYHTVRNHLFIIRRYSKGVNLLGAVVAQLFKVSGYCAYFILRGRFNKLKAVLKGFIHGLIK